MIQYKYSLRASATDEPKRLSGIAERFSSEQYVSPIKTIAATLEKVTANNVFFLKYYALPYKSTLDREINLAQINKEDIVLNVGCGALPYTAIYIACKTGAKVIAIDKDPQVIYKAEKIIKDCSLNRQIKVLNADGKKIENTHFTKAIVALQAAPKKDVLENLLKHSFRGAKLLFRQPRKLFKKHYGMLDESECESFVKHKMITYNKTLLFGI